MSSQQVRRSSTLWGIICSSFMFLVGSICLVASKRRSFISYGIGDVFSTFFVLQIEHVLYVSNKY